MWFERCVPPSLFTSIACANTTNASRIHGALSLSNSDRVSGVTHLTVRGFKSINALERLELGSLNVLIGPNGAGKSNLLDVFRMFAAMARGQLRLFVAKEDGPDALLHRGRKHTPDMEVELAFPNGAYRVGLTAAGHALAVTREETSLGWVGSGHYESDLAEVARTEADPFARYLRKAMCEWRVYHFHDTSLSAGMRQAQPVRDNLQLHADGSNLAPFLRHIRERHPAEYGRILDTVRLAAPFIKDFLYRDEPGERVDLEWLERSLEQGRTFGPRQLSDGTIRFTCLATLLLQPVHMQPSTILIDEPELGLHPAAIETLAALLSRASEARQVIVSTQSVDLLNEMRPDDVLVAERCDDASVFRRLDLDQLAEWLSDHALGELWMMNTFGGRP